MRRPFRICRPLDEAPRAIVRRALAEAANGWSVGCYGAIGEFQYDEGEPGLEIDLDALHARSPRGSLQIGDIDRAQAFAIHDADDRLREIAFCTPLPGGRREQVTEVAPLTFDIGVGAPQIDMMVRLAPDDAATLAALAAGLGKSIFAHDNPAGAAIAKASPTRILVSALARLEVHQPTPPPDGRSPDGPHTHLLPKLVARRRAHPPNSPLPEGLFCGLSLYPRTRL